MSTADYGYGPGARHQDIELDEEKCWALLGSSGIGRFAFQEQGRIQVFPVHYIVLRGGLYFRTSRDGAIAAALPQHGVALQTDSATPSTQSGWSVLVTGSARPVEEDEVQTELFGLAAEEPWAGGVRDYFVRVVAEELTAAACSSPDCRRPEGARARPPRPRAARARLRAHPLCEPWPRVVREVATR